MALNPPTIKTCTMPEVELEKYRARYPVYFLLLCFCPVPDIASTVFLMIHMKWYFIDLLPSWFVFLCSLLRLSFPVSGDVLIKVKE
ncbi:hypothetical protein G3P92_003003 [Escherichia coli]|nr:hypothetical protein [Escherichia coli]ODQ12485.1 hypothetical protein BGK51_20645 [Shigella sp. FC569]EAB5457784.1 hypothetical protein [Escherichia coli]EEW8596432.1 hypothetical protein [Escherichia coli]EFI3452821.1 hypothetical protein [Escherichia coli]